MVKILFGSTEVTKLLDDHGSTKTTETHFRAGKISYPVRTRYNIRIPISDQADEHLEYLAFSDEIKNNKSMLDPAWKIDHTKAGDYAVKSYTVLSYE